MQHQIHVNRFILLRIFISMTCKCKDVYSVFDQYGMRNIPLPKFQSGKPCSRKKKQYRLKQYRSFTLQCLPPHLLRLIKMHFNVLCLHSDVPIVHHHNPLILSIHRSLSDQGDQCNPAIPTRLPVLSWQPPRFRKWRLSRSCVKTPGFRKWRMSRSCVETLIKWSDMWIREGPVTSPVWIITKMECSYL